MVHTPYQKMLPSSGGVRERLASSIEVQSGRVGRVGSELRRGRLSGIRSNCHDIGITLTA